MFEKNVTKIFRKLTKEVLKKILKKLTKLFGLLELSRVHRHPTWYRKCLKSLTKNFQKLTVLKKNFETIWQTFLDSSSHPECIDTLHDIIQNIFSKIWQKSFEKNFEKFCLNFLDSLSHPEGIDTLHDIIQKCLK